MGSPRAAPGPWRAPRVFLLSLVVGMVLATFLYAGRATFGAHAVTRAEVAKGDVVASVSATTVHIKVEEQPYVDPSPVPVPVPKVALMFMSSGRMPQERVWRRFFGLSGDLDTGVHWRHLFSVYVHTSSDIRFVPGMVFYGAHLVEHFNDGDYPRMRAARALLRAAVRDPLNERFVLLHSSSIPLYSREFVYLQALSEQRSRISACVDGEPITKHPPSSSLQKSDLVRSSLFVMLNRKHAKIGAADDEILPHVERICSSSEWCNAEQRWLPTLLAWSGVGNETSCQLSIARSSHKPRTGEVRVVEVAQASPAGLEKLRGRRCSPARAVHRIVSHEKLMQFVSYWANHTAGAAAALPAPSNGTRRSLLEDDAPDDENRSGDTVVFADDPNDPRVARGDVETAPIAETEALIHEALAAVEFGPVPYTCKLFANNVRSEDVGGWDYHLTELLSSMARPTEGET